MICGTSLVVVSVDMKESGINRVVGKSRENPEITEQDILASLTKRYNAQNLPDVEKMEREKTPDEKYVIGVANQVSNQVLLSVGLQLVDVDIGERNVHLIKHENWRARHKDSPVNSEVLLRDGAILVHEGPLLVLAHETLQHMFRLKMFNAMQITDAPKDKNLKQDKNFKQELTAFRTGLSVVSRDGSVHRLQALNNALTEELTMRAFADITKDPVFENEREQTRKLIAMNKPEARHTHLREGVLSAPRRSPLTAEEHTSPRHGLYFVQLVDSKDPKPKKRATARRIDGKWERGKDFVRYFAPYIKERDILNMLIEKLFKLNKGMFKERENVFRLFVQVATTGNMTPLRILNKTFKRDVLSKLGELDQRTKDKKPDIPALENYVSGLPG